MERWSVHFSLTVGRFPRNKSFFPSFDIWVENEAEAAREILSRIRQVVGLAALIPRKSVEFICWADRVTRDHNPKENKIEVDAHLHLLNRYSNKRILKPLTGKKLFVRTRGDNRWLTVSDGDI